METRDLGLSHAIWEGFRVIGRQPFAFLAWSLVYLVLGLGPTILTMNMVGADYVALFQELGAGEEPDSAAIAALGSKVQGLNGVSILSSIACYALLFGAVYRAVLRPEDKRLGYLSLGKDELLQGLLVVVLYVFFIIAMVLGTLALMLPGILLMLASPFIGFPAILLGALGLAGGLIWLFARLGMALPMTFAHRQFRLFEAWPLTRPYAWRLFGMAALLIVLSIVFQLVLMGSLVGAVLAIIGARGFDPVSFFDQSPTAIFEVLGPVGLAASVVLALAGTALFVIMAAPFAAAYQKISGFNDAAAAFD